jgi:hypothetical protein
VENQHRVVASFRRKWKLYRVEGRKVDFIFCPKGMI